MARRLKHRLWSPFKRSLQQRPALSSSFISTLVPLHRLHCFHIQHYTTRMPSFIFQVATAAIALATMAPAATAAPIDITMLSKSHIVQASDVSTHAFPASNVEVRHYHNLYPVMRTLSRDEYYLSTVSLLLLSGSTWIRTLGLTSSLPDATQSALSVKSRADSGGSR